MDKKNYAVMNLAIDSKARGSDYELSTIEESSTFNLPMDMFEYGIITPSEVKQIVEQGDSYIIDSHRSEV